MILETIQNLAKVIDLVFPVNLFIINQNGKIRWANERLLTLSGISDLKTIKGKDVCLFGKHEWENSKRVIESNKMEAFHEAADDKNFLTIKIPYSQGGFHGVAGLSIDITQLEQAKRAKEEFIMNMSHDLRTPLAGIIGLSSLQADQGMSTQERDYGKMIQEAGEQLLELLNSVLEVTAAEYPLESVKREKVDLLRLAQELRALMQPTVQEKGLHLQIKWDPTLPVILSDRIKLKRLLLNLLSNAAKFTKQGEISLEINLLSLDSDQAKIEMRVIDTGIGIAKGNLDKLFDRFYRVHPSYSAHYSGYGLGLYLVKKATELLGGTINVASEEGKGSCFILTFSVPLANEEIKTTEQTINPQSEPITIKESVLVVEDDPFVLFVVKRLLSKLGYEVTAVTKGGAALQALRTQSFAWVLLDIGLPDREGTEVAQQYRKWEQENNKPPLPIFALTAHAGEIKEKCLNSGIDHVFHKPFIEKDIKTIEQFINK